MRVKSMVMVNNCGVLNNKAVGRDGAVPEGGAFCVEGVSANLTVSASMLKENSAVGDACGTDACGGALAAKQGATITIKAVNMSSSVVRGAQRSLGGALCVRSSSVAIELTDFEANQAQGAQLLSAGGALYFLAEGTASLDVYRSTFNANIANGGLKAQGGALWVSAEIGGREGNIQSCDISYNHVVASEGNAYGGGVFQGSSSELRLLQTQLTANTATVQEAGEKASGGGLFAATGARSDFTKCFLALNAAGGTGLFHKQFLTHKGDLADAMERAAMHIYSAGELALHQCTITAASMEAVHHPAWWWLVSQGRFASVALNQSAFLNTMRRAFDLCKFHLDEPAVCDPCDFAVGDSICDSTQCKDGDYKDCGTIPPHSEPSPMGKLLHVLDNVTRVEVRNCTAQNLVIESLVDGLDLGIVNSTFNPPLSSTVPTIQAPDQCSTNELCDPRSQCVSSNSGTGVQCSCDIPNRRDLTTRPGTYPDGRVCLQMMSATLKVESSDYR